MGSIISVQDAISLLDRVEKALETHPNDEYLRCSYIALAKRELNSLHRKDCVSHEKDCSHISVSE